MVDGWVDGSKSHFEDCIQQQKNTVLSCKVKKYNCIKITKTFYFWQSKLFYKNFNFNLNRIEDENYCLENLKVGWKNLV